MKNHVLPSRMRGVSIIEILISLVIGLVVVGAVLVSFIGSGQSSREQSAYAQMSEDAQIAFAIMSRDLLLAGYAQPTGLNADSTLARTYAGNAVFGCDSGFVSPTATGAVACNAAGSNPALEVVYEADTSNTVPTSANVPSDCLGASLAPQVAGAITYFLAHNRYYVATNASGRSELYCASDKAGGTGQPLVENIESMKVWYGEANAAAPRQIVRYVPASAVASWGSVVSVRICLLMRSPEAVLSAGEGTGGYLDCDSVSQTSADRRVRRAFFSTTTLRNKMAF